jgi:hypothetical protein
MAIRLDPIRSKRKMGVRNATAFIFPEFSRACFLGNLRLLRSQVAEDL